MHSLQPLSLSGAYVLTLPAFEDRRGRFIKSFQQSLWEKEGIRFELKESYFSFSAQHVIRGMHFQTPPHHHAKIVFCPAGAIIDVIVDLRKGSITYGQYAAVELSGHNHKAIYIPEGFAHGFLSLQDDSITYYLVSSEYSPAHDTGILYNSFGYNWAVDQPILSERDLSFPDLASFQSPFL